ncbi:hypothetical protein M0802_002693 [Mischocyttarus mexicanus]|nr:hypothetical protein M0802_002693 [Mischocyttarus mexicanus]
MAKLPELDYFMEKQTAQQALQNFNIYLQGVFKEYKKVWGMYLNVVKEHQQVNSKLLHEKKIEIINQDDRNNRSSDSLYFEEAHTTNSIDLMEDSQQQCTSNLISSNESSENISEIINSPVCSKSDSNFKSNSFNKSFCIASSSMNESVITKDNLNIDNEQEISNDTSYAFAKSPTSNVAPIFLYSTPIRNKKTIVKKKQNVKKNTKSKKLSPLNNLRKRNNLSAIRREKALNKTPFKIINNMNLRPSNNSNNSNNGNSNNNLSTIQYNIEVTQTPRSKNYKQTKLVFNKTAEKVESSNNARSNNNLVLTKTNKSANNQEKVLRQSTLTDMINLKEKEINNVCINNIYTQSESCNNTVESTEIKNETIYHQECENSLERNDPLNISDKSGSNFPPEYENNISLDKSFDINFNSDNSSSSWEKLSNKPESKNQLTKKKKIIHLLRARENVIDILDLDESIEESIESSKNGNYKQYRKCRKENYINNQIKKEAKMDVCTVMSPDNSSSTN